MSKAIEAGFLIWIMGTGAYLLYFLMGMRKDFQDPCSCVKARMHLLMTDVESMGLIGLLVMTVAFLAMAAIWPGLVITKPHYRWKHRNDSRCEKCGRVVRP